MSSKSSLALSPTGRTGRKKNRNVQTHESTRAATVRKPQPHKDERVVIIAPVGQDASAMANLLYAEGFETHVVKSIHECSRCISSGAGALLLTEEALELPNLVALLESFKAQPAWSELPVIILTSGGASRVARLLDLAARAAGTVTLLERPISTRTLVSSVHVALRSRRRQYEVRDLLEQQRREHEASGRLAAIVASSSDAILSKTLDGIITSWNAAAQRMFGYTPQEIIGQPILRLIPPDRHKEEDYILARLRAGRHVDHYETVRLTKDGHQLEVSLTISPIRNPKGKIIGASKIIRDVTERKRAEEALRRLTDFDEAVMTNMGEGLYTVDNQGRVTTMNPAAEKLFGWTLAELRGKKMHDVTHYKHPDGSPFPAEECAGFQVLHQGKALTNHEDVFIRKDGTFFDVVYSSSPILENGAITGLVVVFKDITQRKRLEDELRRNQANLAAELTDTKLLQALSAKLIRGENVAVVYEAILDAAVRIMHSDFASMQMLYPERGRGGELRLLGFRGFNPEAAKFWEWVPPNSGSTCALALQTGERFVAQDIEKCELMAGMPDLEVYRGTGIRAVQSTPLISRSGKILGMISTHWRAPHNPSERDLGLLDIVARQAADLIERKLAEDALHQAHEQLADRAKQLEGLVRDRTAKLREMVAELEHVSYAMVHDMRAPLRTMQAFAEILEKESAETSAEQRADYARRITLAANRLDKLIQDALNYNQAVLQKPKLHRVDLSVLVPGILHTYPDLGPEKADIIVEGKLPVVIGNEALLTQCFSNLLTNAVTFVAPGVRPHVRIQADASDGMQRVYVQDNGTGIPSHAHPRVFRLFERLTHDTPGTGLGLAIVRKVVERMGGRVGLESEPGKGSKFWIELPHGNGESPTD